MQTISPLEFLLALLSAVLVLIGVKVIQKPPRQFSLRALFIVTTLVAVVLGLVVWAAR